MHTSSFNILESSLRMPHFLLNKSLSTRMLLLGLPICAFSLLLVFLFLCSEIQDIITSEIARNEQLHAESIAQNLERILYEARNQLRILAGGAIDKKSMYARLLVRKKNENFTFPEVAYVSSTSDDRYVFLEIDNTFVDLPNNIIQNTRLSPFQTIDETDLKPFAVSISKPTEVTYNMIRKENKLQSITYSVIRLSTPIFDSDGSPTGMLILSLDLKEFRNLLSLGSNYRNLHSADSEQDSSDKPFQSPRGFFFDTEGCILFQSEMGSLDEIKKHPLRLEEIRAGLSGATSSPTYHSAFQPSQEYSDYYKMIADIRQKKPGHASIPVGNVGWSKEQIHSECISYAPILFENSPNEKKIVIGGIGILDREFTSRHTIYTIFIIFLICYLLLLLLITTSLWWIGRKTVTRLRLLEEELVERNETNSSQQLSLPTLPIELENIRKNIDTLLSRLQKAETDHATRVAESNAKKLSEPVQDLPSPEEVEKDHLVGISSQMVELRKKINTVANISADVLVVGETGTGKELVSQSIHDASDRSDKPFISINCGALDESLLMDTLFGHVKGAFTEAKQNRKGAFIAANGGTLLLDEIGNAAPKVQQALLRALSTRQIRPLGSDQDIPFSTRIIAATNADLRNDGKDGGFRNDLYFRLAVISIQTPTLRERKEDIPSLVVHFMHEVLSQKKVSLEKLPAISNGALQKLMEYSWPGNIRELKNVITRAMAFAQGDILQAEDIILDAHDDQKSETIAQKEIASAEVKKNIQQILSQLNARQQAVLPILMRQGSITRQEYQKMFQENISMRTAQYDLQQMVQLGLISRQGRGPVMNYYVEGFEEMAENKEKQSEM